MFTTYITRDKPPAPSKPSRARPELQGESTSSIFHDRSSLLLSFPLKYSRPLKLPSSNVRPPRTTYHAIKLIQLFHVYPTVRPIAMERLGEGRHLTPYSQFPSSLCPRAPLEQRLSSTLAAASFSPSRALRFTPSAVIIFLWQLPSP